MIATHEELRAKARTVNNEPTMTDQSGASETDLNVVLKRYAQSGTIQSHGKEPMYYDWTEFPEDFRGYLAAARNAEDLREQLPPGLRNMPDAQLLALTPEQIEQMLTPPAKQTPAGTEGGTT